MAVIRGSIPADNFTIVDNRWLRDPELSWKAKGLLAYIASHARGHRLTREQILAEGADGRDAVVAGLCELERRGYLRRRPVRGEGGKITGTDYELTTVDGPVDDGGGSEKPSSGKPGPGDDQGEQGVSAGGTTTGFSGAGNPAGKKTSSKKTEKTTSSPTARRGTRLPEDFMPDEGLRAWYAENIGQAVDGITEHQKFVNFWVAKPGQGGTKLDWRRTWMNWMLEAKSRAPRDYRTTGGPKPGPRFPTASERSQERVRTEVEILTLAEDWIEEHGGNPADPDLLRKVAERIKTEIASATRTPGLYSDIDGEVVTRKEVTAGEGS